MDYRRVQSTMVERSSTMTEDDTFNKLKKATFADVRIRINAQTFNETKHGSWIQILESMGWTREEYISAIMEAAEDGADRRG